MIRRRGDHSPRTLTRTRTLPRRTRPAAAVLAVGVTAGLLGAGVGGAAPAAAYGRVVYASPGADLNLVMTSLRAGDTLRLRPGIYNAGYVRPEASPGTAQAPITVMADDPNNRPLIRGIVKLWKPDYWVLRGLRIQATVPKFEALYLGGGTGWKVENGEFFGARATGAYDNVAIANDQSGRPPRNFRFTTNCVHGAANTTRSNTDHNIYVLFSGNVTNHGVIDHNIIFDHPNGEGIKLGAGGAAGTRGPWGVFVAFNTITNGGRQILLTGDVRYNSIKGNLLTQSKEPFTRDPRTTAIYVNLVAQRLNAISNNYFWAESMVKYDPYNKLIDRGDNRLRPAPGYVLYGSCYGFRTTNAAAAPYGRYGNGRW